MSRGITLLFLGPRHAKWEWGVNPTPRPPLCPREKPGTHCTGGWMGPRAVPTRIRSRTVQPVAQSLYRLSHPAHRFKLTYIKQTNKQTDSSYITNNRTCCIRKIYHSTLIGRMAVYSERRNEYVNTLCGQTADLLW